MKGVELRKLRIRLRLTQAGLAAKLGVNANTVARWERGEVTPGHPEMLRRALKELAGATGGRNGRHKRKLP
jgi:transcriptional regulator with XRE-family HTH domain